jgi:hypothetical protein
LPGTGGTVVVADGVVLSEAAFLVPEAAPPASAFFATGAWTVGGAGETAVWTAVSVGVGSAAAGAEAPVRSFTTAVILLTSQPASATRAPHASTTTICTDTELPVRLFLRILATSPETGAGTNTRAIGTVYMQGGTGGHSGTKQGSDGGAGRSIHLTGKWRQK